MEVQYEYFKLFLDEAKYKLALQYSDKKENFMKLNFYAEVFTKYNRKAVGF